jgi:hypothetical protein
MSVTSSELERNHLFPPSSDYLRVLTVFDKVLYLCGAAEYMQGVEKDAEDEGISSLNEGTNFASYLV